MSAQPPVLKGIVRNGVIVFEAPWPLPDGTEVEFTVTRHVFTPEEHAEWKQWEQLGDEAWAMIEKWEAEEDAQDRPPQTTDSQ